MFVLLLDPVRRNDARRLVIDPLLQDLGRSEAVPESENLPRKLLLLNDVPRLLLLLLRVIDDPHRTNPIKTSDEAVVAVPAEASLSVIFTEAILLTT